MLLPQLLTLQTLLFLFCICLVISETRVSTSPLQPASRVVGRSHAISYQHGCACNTTARGRLITNQIIRRSLIRADILACGISCFMRSLITYTFLPSCIHAHSPIFLIVIVVRLDFPNLANMQLSSTQSTLSWLLLPVLALAATPSSGGLTKVGTGQLNLLTPQHLDTSTLDRAVYCKNEDPYQFTSSRNYTFPDTPAISQSDMVKAGFGPNDGGEYPFDCFMELPGGYVVFEVRCMPRILAEKKTRRT